MTEFLECGPFVARTGEGQVLFQNASLALADRQCVCLEGPSGSGKSTLLRHITAHAWSPDPMRRLEGKSYSGADLPAWRSRVCLIAQDAPMLTGSVLENLSFPFVQRAAGGREFNEQEAIRLLAAVGMADLPMDRDIRLLSGGERHRLALVRAILWDPPVLVADEVLSGLDPSAAEACLALLMDYAHREGRLLVCVLHDPDLFARADKRFELRAGHLEEF